jgi:leucyl-tRNA---protein transferase
VEISRTIVNGPEACPYLPHQLWAMQYAEIARMAPSDYERPLLDGWFKFGSYLQRPLCHWCRACRAMRVPLAEWRPTRSHRRILNKNAALRIEVHSPPKLCEHRVRLYNDYRTYKHLLAGWAMHPITPSAYLREFIDGPTPMVEITAWDGDRLLAVLLMDELPDSMTAVTHFYDPSYLSRKIGLYIVLQSFLLAQKRGKQWLYLGYFVPQSPTMGYKRQFTPCELRDWNGSWQRVEA